MKNNSVDLNNVTLIVKVEIANLLDSQGQFSERKMDRLCRVVSGIRNSGVRVLLVSSGAIYLGSRATGIRPFSFPLKQALAATGQVYLMEQYQQFFGLYNQVVAQILITSDVVNDPVRNLNARNTLEKLLSMGVIPVVNENDSVSTEDIELDDNYYLVLRVAGLVRAGLLLVQLPEEGRFLLIRGKETEETSPESEYTLLEKISMYSSSDKPSPVCFPEKVPQHIYVTNEYRNHLP